eukprot:TRINITY_DN2158_c0_g1_i1.p1 TRINITY_DN2158_c0_g1~~TRINITY_DN2158_c0_g1_i1.p1  ORF type:complete len:475 (-),score=83.80 TRINITY_DN2158_c0_g1_i1:48-1472(-)
MKVCLLSCGSPQDVKTALAFGVVLRDANLDVAILTHDEYGALVASYGIVYHRIHGRSEDFWKSSAINEAILAKDPLAMFEFLSTCSSKILEDSFNDFLEGCRGADMIVATPMCYDLSYTIAEYLQVPLLALTTAPSFPSKSLPMPQLQTRPIDGILSFLNILVHEAYALNSWQQQRSTHNMHRERLGLKPIKNSFGIYPLWKLNKIPSICACDSSLSGWATDIPEQVKTIGFLTLPPAQNSSARLEDKIEKFLASGPKPVYFSIESTPGSTQDSLLDMTVQAVDRVGCRAVISVDPNSSNEGKGNKNVLIVKNVTTHLMLPRCKSVLHSCDANMIGETINAGIPHILVPFIGEQHFWADRIHKLGVSPTPIPWGQLDVDLLSESIICTLSPDQVKCAQELRLKTEKNGSPSAKALIEFHGTLSKRQLIDPDTASIGTIWLLPQLKGIVSGATFLVCASLTYTTSRLLLRSLIKK